MTPATPSTRPALPGWLSRNLGPLGGLLALIAFPFVVAAQSGDSPVAVLTNESGNAKFYQGLFIEVFILAIYALSYDLVLGVTGLLSFGHALFFGMGAYATGILIKSFGWELGPTIVAVIGIGVTQALAVGVVLPRVKGVTFALVTLGMASVFHIVVQTHELSPWTGGDVGLQGLVPPAILNPNADRLRFYLVSLAVMVLAWLAYKRFVDSPTGRVCNAIRENEGRALMLGYNTFVFKLIALTIASVTAALAGSLHALYQPIVSPNVASLSFTVAALLMILMGGVGTLTGALFGALAYRLLAFFLDRWFGQIADVLLGVVYIALVLFVPYGIVGTWRRRRGRGA